MISVPNRPFSTDIITGMMLPDGIFVATLGKQLINAHFTNSGASTVADSNIYLESVSHPGIVVTPNTHHASNLASGASRVCPGMQTYLGHRQVFITSASLWRLLQALTGSSRRSL